MGRIYGGPVGVDEVSSSFCTIVMLLLKVPQVSSDGQQLFLLAPIFLFFLERQYFDGTFLMASRERHHYDTASQASRTTSCLEILC
jgi:hypothetical protein